MNRCGSICEHRDTTLWINLHIVTTVQYIIPSVYLMKQSGSLHVRNVDGHRLCSSTLNGQRHLRRVTSELANILLDPL